MTLFDATLKVPSKFLSVEELKAAYLCIVKDQKIIDD